MLEEFIEKVLQNCSVCKRKKCFTEYPCKKNGMPKSDICNECKVSEAKRKRAESAAKRKAEREAAKVEAKKKIAASSPVKRGRKSKKEEQKEPVVTLSMAIRNEMLSRPIKQKKQKAPSPSSPKRKTDISSNQIPTKLSENNKRKSPTKSSVHQFVTKEEFDALTLRLESAIVGLWHTTDLAQAVGENSNFQRDLSRDQIYEIARSVDPSGELTTRIAQSEADKKKIHYRNAMLDKSFHGCVVPPHKYVYNYIPDPREDIPGAQAAIDKIYPCECRKNKEAMFAIYVKGTNPNDNDLAKFEGNRRRKTTKDIPHSPRI